MLSAAGSNELDVADRLRNLVRSRLIDAAEMEKLFATAPPDTKLQPTDFLNFLIEHDLIDVYL